MDLTVTNTRAATIIAANLTPITGAAVSLAIGPTTAPITLDPTDAFDIGDALKDAARRAGYTPKPTTPPAL